MYEQWSHIPCLKSSCRSGWVHSRHDAGHSDVFADRVHYYSSSVLDTKRTDERSGNVLELVERRLHRDLQLRCGLRSLKRSNADVRARLCRCCGRIVERKRTNVHPRYVSNAKRRTDERQRAGDDGYEQARLCCDVHVQQRLRPLIRKSTYVRTERRDFIRCMERLGADVRDCDVPKPVGSD